MKNIGYYNGKIAPIDFLMIPACDRACYFGDGIYDAAMANNRRIFALPEHLDRFYHGAETVGIQVPMPRERLQALLLTLLEQVDSCEQFVYFQVSRGVGIRSHIWHGDSPAALLIFIHPLPLRRDTAPLKLHLCADWRHHRCDLKTLSLLPAVLMANEAAAVGSDECLLHRNGRITECSHANVSILQNGVFITPPTDQWILPGVARAHLLRLCRALGVSAVEKEFTIDDIKDAEEVLISSSSVPCARAAFLDDMPVGGRNLPLFEKLHHAAIAEYDCCFSGETDDI